MAQKNVYKDSPFGPIKFPHFNKPDDKFNKDNPPFHGTMTLSGEVALKFKEQIDEAVDAAFEAYFETGQGKDLKPAQRAKWSKYYPYTEVEDDDGNKTGDIEFDFKQNSVIRTADGEKHVEIGLYDANGDEMDPKKDFVRAGAICRIRHSKRAITLKTGQQVGVRLDFSMVQVKEQPARSGGGFGKVDGGYTKGQQSDEDDGDEDRKGFHDDSSSSSSDY